MDRQSGVSEQPWKTSFFVLLSCLTSSVLPSLAAGFTSENSRNERATGIEPAWPAWKAGTLPLSYARALATSELGKCDLGLVNSQKRLPPHVAARPAVAP